ncbi:MAG: 3-deoxy-manno-octulosonate cytidylyltransferase [Robiginitomaculum sp.]|nr:3-deoxy-manno-octulosonate cytidylyltransferase [Robiginitomaculum sp.]
MSKKQSHKLTPLVVIPARMASQRLPGKPLADIGGVPMIVHVLQRALAANVGPVVVACAETEILDAIRASGGQAVMTDPNLPSGTDRVRAAADIVDPEKKYNCVVNVQGDLPTLNPLAISAAVDVLMDVPECDISTLVVATKDPREIADPNVVKAVLSMETDSRGRALYFTRAAAPSGAGAIWHHVGIYAYRRAALDRFCALPPSPLERREKLEQLRALESGMRIDAALIDSEPHGVDTPEDLQRARDIILGKTT